MKWSETILGSICDIVMGQSPEGSSCNRKGDGVPLLNGPTEFCSYSPRPVQYTIDPKRLAQSGDILFCVRGSTTGRMNYADQSYAIGRGLASLRHKNGIEYQSYLKGVIEFLLPALLRDVTGSTFPNLSRDQLLNIKFRAPNSVVQHRISSILSSLDDKIELNRQMNQTLEEMTQAMYKHYFVDGIDKENLPDGWRMGKLGDLMEFKNGKSSPLRSANGIYKVYGANGAIGQADKFNADERTVVIGRVGSFCGSIHLSMEKCWVTDNAIIGTVKQSYFGYTLNLLRTLQLNNLRVGSGQPLLNQGILSSIDTIIPATEKCSKFNEQAYSLLDLAWSNDKEMEYLTETRDYLLPKLISGEIIPAELKEIEQAL